MTFGDNFGHRDSNREGGRGISAWPRLQEPSRHLLQPRCGLCHGSKCPAQTGGRGACRGKSVLDSGIAQTQHPWAGRGGWPGTAPMDQPRARLMAGTAPATSGPGSDAISTLISAMRGNGAGSGTTAALLPAGEGEGKLSMMQRVPKITEINLPVHALQDCHGDAQIQERSTCAGTD